MIRTILQFTLAITALSLRAEYLFWQVSDSTLASGYLCEIGAAEGDKAILHYGSGDVAQGTWIDVGSQDGKVGGDGTAETSYQVKLDCLSDASSYSYYVEIVRNDISIAVSETQTYANLADSVHCIGDIATVSSIVPWTGGSYMSVPEPSSAMMLVVGVAFIGLIRRRS